MVWCAAFSVAMSFIFLMHGGKPKFPGSRFLALALVPPLAFLVTRDPWFPLSATLGFAGLRYGEHGPFLTFDTAPPVREPDTAWGKFFDKLGSDTLAFGMQKSVQLIPFALYNVWFFANPQLIMVAISGFCSAAVYAVLARIAAGGIFISVAEVVTGLLFGVFSFVLWRI